MSIRFIALFLLGIPAGALLAGDFCAGCHEAARQHLGDHHRFIHKPCVSCHGGDGAATEQATAHTGLIARPGELDNADRACAGCHARQHQWISASPMRTNAGIVATTRSALGHPPSDRLTPITDLGLGPTDSLLRKLCAGCHLGRSLTNSGGDPVDDRGGGCLACHLRQAANGEHPVLDSRVSDANCFGCHSRSGRISLSYAGLGEVTADDGRSNLAGIARLGDGRYVERHDADIHHRAGMGCIDCHTGPGVMGGISARGLQGPDIACTDCHANRNRRLTANEWPPEYRNRRDRLPFESTTDQPFLTTAAGTPLWHIDVHEDRPPTLYRKSDLAPLEIPQVAEDHFDLASAHSSLTCDACHATWAPQCYGCHITYDESEPQWDYLSERETPGAWRENRWNIRNAPPPLGRRGDGKVDVFVPGMILTMEHPSLEKPLFLRRFARLSPHTTGPARSCEDCHRESRTLGLGDGDIRYTDDGLGFAPVEPPLQDGLPADAWASLTKAPESDEGDRPFAPPEIKKLLTVPLP